VEGLAESRPEAVRPLFPTSAELLALLGKRGEGHHPAGLAHAQARLAELAGPGWAGGTVVAVSGGQRHALAAGEMGFRRDVVLWERARAQIGGCEHTDLVLGLLVEVGAGWRLLAL